MMASSARAPCPVLYTTSVAIAGPCAGIPWVHARACYGMPAANRRAGQTQDGRRAPSRQHWQPKRLSVGVLARRGQCRRTHVSAAREKTKTR